MLALLGALVCVSMMVFLSGRGTVMQYVILAFLTALCLAGAVTNFIRISRIVGAVKDPDGLVRDMTPAEAAAVGARMIAGKRVLTDNILFSWQNLSSVEDGEGPLSPEETEKVRQPFALPMKRGLALITLRRKEPRIPYTNVPDTMDASVRRSGTPLTRRWLPTITRPELGKQGTHTAMYSGPSVSRNASVSLPRLPRSVLSMRLE